MANQNGAKYGFTGLFPIAREQSANLRAFLRSLDDKKLYARGSPLSDVSIVHMARFVIIDRLAYQGTPAKVDTLKSHYLLFVCDFDGRSIDALIHAMVQNIPHQVSAERRGGPRRRLYLEMSVFGRRIRVLTHF